MHTHTRTARSKHSGRESELELLLSKEGEMLDQERGKVAELEARVYALMSVTTNKVDTSILAAKGENRHFLASHNINSAIYIHIYAGIL